MIVSINQPAYLPWLGYFDRIAQSDIHVVLDHVQFEKGSVTNRNKIKWAHGTTMLTVPVLTRGRFGNLPILATKVGQGWRKKHKASLLQSYAKAPHLNAYKHFIESVYSQKWTHLAPLLKFTTDYLRVDLGIETPLLYSSLLRPVGTKSDLVLDICQRLSATTYLSGPFGRDYLDEGAFKRAGIQIEYHEYHHPVYPQCQGSGFLSHLSVIDLLMNCGPSSLGVLTNRKAAA